MHEGTEKLTTKLRQVARQLWREYPHLSFEDMSKQPDIQSLVPPDEKIILDQLVDWVKPELTPIEELPSLKAQKIWTLGDAAALWLDINPFIFYQAFHLRNPSFYNMPIFPGLRERWMQLRDSAIQMALLGELKTIVDKEQHWIKPRDFYEWAMKNTEGPSYRAECFFAELKTLWDEEDKKLKLPEKVKAPSKVDTKLAEIKRIIELIKIADTEFDPLDMPGKRIDFKNFCLQINKKLFSVSDETFNDYLVGLCKFNSGARETDYYKKIAVKLG
ncbi:MAG: hypothetical protein Q8O24_00055 [Gallionellaceae bacterium]|nr:hypothetical protein [Gallionellaceae bacterium]